MSIARGPLGAAAFLAALAFSSRADGGPAPQESDRKMPEYELKAGFLYNFAKYVEWPASAFEKAETPIVIGIVGTDPFGTVLEKTLKDRTAQDRKFTLTRFKDARDSLSCHLLFVPKAEKPRLADIFKRVEGRSTLTVGEDVGFAKAGGMVNILIEEGRPRLEINTEASDRAKLTIQARLLKLATIVKTEK